MGSRRLPTECHHGTTVDWGDFGPCQDCSEHGWDGDCPNFTPCEQCEVEAQQARSEGRKALVQALHEALDNDVRVTKHTGATRSLSDWERDDIVASVMRTLDEHNAH